MRDCSPRTGKIVAQLAESGRRPDPTTWRLKRHQDLKFMNGEVFDSDKVVVAVENMSV